MHKVSVGAIAVAMAAVSLLSVHAGPAQAAQPATPAAVTTHIVTQNRATGRCLDDSFEAGVRAFACNSRTWQRWDVIVREIGIVNIQSQSTRRCLDASTQFGLRSIPCHYVGNQLWGIYDNGDGYAIRNQVTRQCLDDSGAGLRMVDCNGLVYQRWHSI